MPTLLFVTPAHRRPEISEICAEQRALVIEQLRPLGVEARAVYISDDENLEIARELGFDTIERDNRALGARFNDGYEHAVRERFDFAFPLGSDSFIDAELVAELVHHDSGPEAVRCSRWYTAVHPTGKRRVTIFADRRQGVGYVVPVPLLERAQGRPAAETIKRGCDSSMLRGIAATGPLRFEYSDRHPFEHVGFQSGRTQVTGYHKLGDRHGRHPRSREQRFDSVGAAVRILERHYPKRLVRRVRIYYRSGRALVS